MDVIIIGAGPGGYEAAALEAAKGLKVLLIERDQLGGTCLNRGCIPTKTYCRSAELALDLRKAPDLGIDLQGVQPRYDMARILERKNAVVDQLRQGVQMAVAKAEVVKGNARFVGPMTVEVDGTEYSAPKIIVATGSEPACLPIPGRELTIDSTQMLQLDELPQSLAVIGGGVIGLEFASIFAALGVKVSVIEYCKEILPPFDKDIAKRLRTTLQKSPGIDFYVGAEVKSVSEQPDGLKSVHFLLKGKEQEVQAQRVLMAVGRRPVVPEGFAEQTGVEVGRRGILVDENLQTTVPGLYAIGDCNGRCMLAHAASAQAARVAGERINLDVIPSAVFTVPECAMVGRTEEQIKAEGIAVKSAKIPFRGNGKAVAMAESEGLIKVMVAAPEQPENSHVKPGQILGAAICGPHASDLIAEPALAMAAGLSAADICATIHSHPSLSEAVLAAFRAVA